METNSNSRRSEARGGTNGRWRRFENQPGDVPVAGYERHQDRPTFRGWILGLLSVIGLCLVIPYFDFVLRGTMFSNNMFPATAIFILIVLVGLLTATLSMFKKTLGLTRADLVLVFSMAMLVNAIPGCGFWAFWVGEVTGGDFYTHQIPGVQENVLRHVPECWRPRPPEGRPDVKPIQWFYTGLPPGEAIPWGAWLKPYAIWSMALLMIFGMLFALCGLLRRQWSEREQLSFPLAQLPEDMIGGLHTGGEKQTPFLKDRRALWGIAIAFCLLSYNCLSDYFHKVPKIPLGANMDPYLTEPPLNAFRPVWCYIYVSVIGLTFLLPLEISFSLWFFFIVQKIITFFCSRAGMFEAGTVWWSGPFDDLGGGALMALSLAAFWSARRELFHSLKAAIDPRLSEEDPADFSPRTLWLLLFGCALGSVAWLVWSGIGFGWSVMILSCLIVAMVGLTRLSCEGGIFFMQMVTFPSHMVQMVAPPPVLGPSNFVKLTIWDRVMVADWYRVAFMPAIMNSLHLAARTGVRRSSLMAGMGLAVVVALAVSFGSFLHTSYTHPGGAQAMAWYFWGLPKREYRAMNEKVIATEAWEQRKADAAAEGRELLPNEVSDVAKRETSKMGWMAAGAVFLLGSLALRSIFFWFPHPIGFVMWMGPYPLLHMWFSFMLGWAIKSAILKYGGNRVYLAAKRFFIGLVVGEALVAVIWKILAALFNNVNGYAVLPT